MNRMHAIVHAAAARLPATHSASGGLPGCLVNRSAGYVRQRYAATTLPSRFQIA